MIVMKIVAKEISGGRIDWKIKKKRGIVINIGMENGSGVLFGR